MQCGFLGFEVPLRACGENRRKFKSATLGGPNRQEPEGRGFGTRKSFIALANLILGGTLAALSRSRCKRRQGSAAWGGLKSIACLRRDAWKSRARRLMRRPKRSCCKWHRYGPDWPRRSRRQHGKALLEIPHANRERADGGRTSTRAVRLGLRGSNRRSAISPNILQFSTRGARRS
jgi:hypothetical protein